MVSLYFITLVVLVILDLAWVGGFARSYYQSQLGGLLSAHVILGAVAVFYLIYAAGVVYFVLMPAIAAKSLIRAAVSGAFLGLLAYGTYDLTNLATTTGWPLTMSIVDMAWGTVEGAVLASITYLIATSVLGM